ncbi:CREB3 regulatory factor isoform X2 [Salmo salar]|uniref:CREB3 regulatory factor isoform X2 n=1 Tax=Salmo salar TaxID=8030 RepID=A0A1S3RMJ6_SALSA|nr:CREB3 regulatory factor isoform X2 [Salmo salar]|eukprot:XP_014053556.1 PREDICTED: CREB3 regulatory factor-like isoform X2 [Salmo salar]
MGFLKIFLLSVDIIRRRLGHEVEEKFTIRNRDRCSAMPQPGISGMDLPFGDFFQNYTFADQALTSTDLLASNTDPDFMYELDREMTACLSPRVDHFTVGDCKEMECGEHLMELVDSDPAYSSNFEQWDTYWEDLTKYTRFTSCDIWGTKEAGLDDFSSPYQDEEVIARTPTLAQLNSEDSQPPVCDTLYHPDLLIGGQKQHTSLHPLSLSKKTAARPGTSSSCSNLVKNPLGDFAKGSQKATWPVPSSTETMSKAQGTSKMATLGYHCNDYVRKAKVRISMPHRPLVDMPTASHQVEAENHFTYSSKPPELATTSGCAAPVAAPATAASASASASTLAYEKTVELPRREMPPASVGTSGAVPPMLHYPVAGAGASETLLTASGTDPVSDKKKEEEHNYSLFLTRARLAGKALTEEEEEEEEEEEDEEEEVGEDEEDAEGVELDEDLDEDHDEGFGSEHELSENDDEEDEEDDDYEGDKDDDMSDAFSEPGCDNDAVEDVKGLTAGISRKRGKRRYFWEYSEQLTPSKQECLLKPSEWDRETLPSNMYQRNGPHHGKYTLKKSRRTDVEDLTPNPRKLLQIGNELRKLNKVISDLTPVSELPLTARPRSRKEKNKLASRACRLKKKAQYEANKVKLWGLGTEYDRLLFVINTIKEEIVNRVQDICDDKGTSMTETLDKLIQETLVKSPVAGQTSDFVNQILENTGKGDPTGGLVGLRVPTSRV